VFTPSDLIEACAGARDAPLDGQGEPDRLPLIKALQAELGVLWSDLLGRLPATRDVDLSHDTEAARKFRQALILIWTRPQTFEVRKATDGDGKDVAARASLAFRVRYQAREYLEGRAQPLNREKWRVVQEAFVAWWRPFLTDDGEPRIALAMRWELASQVGVELPGVDDQASLTTLAKGFGCLSLTDTPPARMADGTRLATLAAPLTDELLSRPADDPEDDFTDTDAPEGQFTDTVDHPEGGFTDTPPAPE
jgi:hypothetical protein